MTASRSLESTAVATVAVFAISALCAEAAAASRRGTEVRTLAVGGATRSYSLHVPPSLPKDRPAPLVLVFHGGGGTPVYAERETGFSELADREGFLVAYPEGVGRSWNDGRDVEAIHAQREGVDDLAFVAALIDDAARVHPVARGRVYATGISNGGMFSHYLAAKLSSRIAAVAPVAGGLPEKVAARLEPEEPVAILMLSGTEDPLVPYGGGDVTLLGKPRGRIVATEEAARRWAALNRCEPAPAVEDVPDRDPEDGCSVKWIAYAGGEGCTEVGVYRMEGAGHTWPDGRQYLPARLIGTVCHDFDGAEAIWEFFQRHPKPAAPEAAPSPPRPLTDRSDRR